MPPAPPSGVSGPERFPWPMLVTAWRRKHSLDASAVMGAVVLLHAAALALLVGVVVPLHLRLGEATVGVGLGFTAYTYGLRHALDADHIAAIDNTTRKLRGDGRRSASVGFWFAMGHSTMVVVLAALVAGGARLAASLTNSRSAIRSILGLLSTTVSGVFLYVIAAINLAALAGLARTFRQLRADGVKPADADPGVLVGGFVTRALGRLNRTVTRPWQMYLVGLLFGLGFDTATEISLLVLAGTGAAERLPWFAIMALPLAFAAGMSLLDSLDGLFMSIAYDWAFLHPVRKIYYNLSITGLSVAVALLIGTIELVGVLHDQAGWHNGVADWVSRIRMNDVGLLIAAMFVATWAVAVTTWRLLRLDERSRPGAVYEPDAGE